LATLPTHAEALLPPWMWGGQPEKLLEAADLHARRLTPSADTWRVQAGERYRRVRPSLFFAETLAGPGAGGGGPRWQRLTHAAHAAATEDPGRHAPEHRVRHRLDRAGSGGLLGHLSAAQLLTMDAPPDVLASTVEQAHNALVNVEAAERPGYHPLSAAGVHLVHRSAQVVHRVKLTAALLQLEHDPALRAGDPRVLNRLQAGEMVLQASSSLSDGVLLLDAYLGPLLGALTPFVWATATPRALGTIVYSFGSPLQGVGGEPTELMHLLPVGAADRDTPMPTLEPGAADAALQWWVARLNELFGVLTDPAIFTDRQGRYRPATHLQALMTVEQLFRRVHSTQLAHRDATARRALLFTALDTVERLAGEQINHLGSHRHARQVLDRLEQEVPVAAASILLPVARRAVDALAATGDGLYLLRRTGAPTVEVGAGPGARRLDRDTAVGEYLKVRRDATHGHGAHRPNRKPLTDALLAHHTGELPHDVGLLAYLYLLDLLCRPEPLARRLHTDARNA
jgi:hypothetical protein